MIESPLLRQRLTVVGLICTAAAFLEAQLLLLSLDVQRPLFERIAAQPSLWTNSHVALLLWLGCTIMALCGLWAWVSAEFPRLALLGLVLGSVGVVVEAVIVGIDFVAGAMAQSPDRSAMIALHQRISSTMLSRLDVFDVGLLLGLVVLGCGLYRSQRQPQLPMIVWLVGLAIPLSSWGRIVAPMVQFVGLLWWLWRSWRMPQQRFSYHIGGTIGLLLAFGVAAVWSLERVIVAAVVLAVLAPMLRARDALPVSSENH